MRFTQSVISISLATLLAAGCGGGGGADSLVPANAGGVTRIVTFGDSLSDPGAYALAAIEKGGGRFTVNGPNAKVWTELVAADYGLPLRPNQVVTDAGPQINPTGTSYAEGGARVTRVSASAAELNSEAYSASQMTPLFPAGFLTTQPTVNGLLTTTIPCSSSSFTKSVFGLTPAGDVENMMGIYDANLAGCVQLDTLALQMAYPKDNAGIGFYVSTLTNESADLLNVMPAGAKTRSGITTLPITEQTNRFVPTTVTTPVTDASKTLVTVLGGANDLFTIIGLISKGFLPAPSGTNASFSAIAGTAQTLAIEVRRLKALGYNKILVGNIPDLSKTPFFEQTVLANTPSGASPSDAATIRTQTTALFQGITQIYNASLLKALAVNVDPMGPPLPTIEGVKFLDLFTLFNGILSDPAANGLNTSVDITKVTACKQGLSGTPLKGAMQTNPSRLPLKTTNSSLFCNASDLVAADAASTYLFADGVHPTPKGHQLIAAAALAALREANWR